MDQEGSPVFPVSPYLRIVCRTYSDSKSPNKEKNGSGETLSPLPNIKWIVLG